MTLRLLSSAVLIVTLHTYVRYFKLNLPECCPQYLRVLRIAHWNTWIHPVANSPKLHSQICFAVPLGRLPSTLATRLQRFSIMAQSSQTWNKLGMTASVNISSSCGTLTRKVELASFLLIRLSISRASCTPSMTLWQLDEDCN